MPRTQLARRQLMIEAGMRSDLPYTYHVVESGLLNDVFEIRCEGCPIRNFTGKAIEAQDIVFLLNTAYELGQSSGFVQGRNEPTA